MAPLTKEDLIQHFRAGCKPQNHWQIGLEHEKLIYDQKTLKRVPYAKGIESILKALEEFGWKPIFEKEQVIALSKGQAFVTLEPGGQLELSGAPFTDVHQVAQEIQTHLKDLKTMLDKLGFFKVMMGYDPKWPRDAMPWMPKGRYDIMRPYMAQKGSHGQDMMTATCTVQVNLDFSSEQDMVKKFRVAMALQPLAIALFANSPFSQGRPNGFESYRSWIWHDTDPDRCGLLPFVFEGGMGFERYVDYALQVPMYFVYRAGTYINVAGQSFKDFMKGQLPGFPGEIPTLKDWENHLTTLFPEVRLKQYLELRGADNGAEPHLYALPAFWVGLLYDAKNLDDLNDRVQEWPFEELQKLYETVCRQGLSSIFQNQPLRHLASELVALSKTGLNRRAKFNPFHQDESIYLSYLEELLTSNESSAQKHLHSFQTLYHNDMNSFLRELF